MVVVVALVFAGAVAALVLWPSSERPPVARAQPFSLPDVRANRPPVALAAHPGHPVVLNFFAAWCDPCHAEVPLLADQQRAQGSRLEVLGVDVQDNRGLAGQLLADASAAYPAGYDPNRVVSDAWQVDVGLPVTVFVAADGAVVDYHRGQLGEADLAALVARLLRSSAAHGGTGA